MKWFLLCLAAALFNNANAQSLIWPVHSSVNELVGPENAVHCRATDPSGTLVYSGFGRCHLVIEDVATSHTGFWTMSVTLPDHVLPQAQSFSVQVTSLDTKATVTTLVTQQKPLIELTCSVPVTQEVTGCVFRDPSGRVLQARSGVSEDRYSFVESTLAGVQSCGIQINGPLISDLGIWRCDLQTQDEVYYGHITVLCPWAMMDPTIAASVVAEPTLTAETRDVYVAEGETATMSCSVQSPIRYCYFRARNGRIFNVRPGLSSSTGELSYVGAGLDAGECGMRITGLVATDTGAWSCHVGFPDASISEQRHTINLVVREALSVQQYVDEGHKLMVMGEVHQNLPVDYCRFVRIDGTGFTSENVLSGYIDRSNLQQGQCMLLIEDPTILDHHPWTIAAKVTGQDVELSQSTDHTIEMPQPAGVPRKPWWVPVLIVLSVALIVTAIFSFKRNRRWAFERASKMRNSLHKEPLPDTKPPTTMPA